VTKDIKWLGWGALLEVDSLVEKGKESILLVYWEVGEWHQFSSRADSESGQLWLSRAGCDP
jgi:hypothetical protein